MTYSFDNYRILFTPLVRAGVYGSTVDVTQDIDMTEFIRQSGLQTINRELDNGDYDVGIFTFGDITLRGINIGRKFNDENDALSIFPYSRDLCKVEVRLYDPSGSYTTRFRGLIDEQGTRANLSDDTIRFKILSMDSILRKTEVSGGSIATGDLFSTAIKKILNVPEITNILNYNPANITVDLDLTIDDGDHFSSKSVKQAIDEILVAANAILTIDTSDNIVVKPRQETATVFSVYGRGDLFGKENILSISELNSGTQRAFSSIVVNDIEEKNEAWIQEYGYRPKSISMGFMTDIEKIRLIAANILSEFRVPKPEVSVTVPTKDVSTIQLLDTVKIYYDYRKRPHDNNAPLAFTGSAVTGSAVTAKTIGATRIMPNEKWKVIGISERPISFETTLKLRRAGQNTYDGFFGSGGDFNEDFNDDFG